AKKNRLHLLHNIYSLTDKMHWGKTNATLARLPQGAFLLPTQGKPTWSVAQYPFEATVVKIYELPAAQLHQSKASIYVDQRLDAQHQAKNIVGMIPGTEVPDSFIVLTAHYD